MVLALRSNEKGGVYVTDSPVSVYFVSFVDAGIRCFHLYRCGMLAAMRGSAGFY
jgi:hypothetical protein